MLPTLRCRIGVQLRRQPNLKTRDTQKPGIGAFSLTELLVVIAIIVVLAALILPAVSRAPDRTRTADCANRLYQIGVAMEMYVSENNIYPTAIGGAPLKTWADQLAAYNPLDWTNVAWHCPTYIAEGGRVVRQLPPPGGGPFTAFSSYAYNSYGMLGYGTNGKALASKSSWLGLGHLRLTVPENRVVAPSEMYAVADTRPLRYEGQSGVQGSVKMNPWNFFPPSVQSKDSEANPPHADGYNLLFADTHVSLVKRCDYLYPPRTAQNWNRDNQPHPEFWCPTSEWAVQN